MALAPMSWRGRRDGQAIKNRYLVGTYDTVVPHRSLPEGRYVTVGLRRDPKFIQALDVVRPPWDP